MVLPSSVVDVAAAVVEASWSRSASFSCSRLARRSPSPPQPVAASNRTRKGPQSRARARWRLEGTQGAVDALPRGFVSGVWILLPLLDRE